MFFSKNRWTWSTLSMSYLQCGDQTEEQYSGIGRTYVSITDAFREWKRFKINLHLDIALCRIKAMCLSNLKRLSTVGLIQRSRIE